MTRASDWNPARLADAPPLRDAGEAHVWLLALDDPPWPQDELCGLLDAAESQRAERFHFPHDARRYRAAHGLLRLLLAHYTRVAACDIGFSLGPAGKPGLAGPAAQSGLAFSLSHSGDLALVGLTCAPCIGVDIERGRPMPDQDAIAASHFAPTELRAWRALPAALRADAFFAAWTRKEAYVKALGGGLSIPLTAFEVALDPRQPAALLAVFDDLSAADRWTLWSEPARPGVWAAAAIQHNPARVRTFSLRST